MEIKSLNNVNFNTLYKAFSRAFATYDMQLNEEQLKAMLKRRGFNPELSFAAFDGNEIVAFTFNGTGNFNGLPTAYDTGTGTLKEYRGQGLATKIFEHSIPFLRQANIRQYLLEVLQHNTKAVSVYRNIGFQVSRELSYFVQKNENVSNSPKQPNHRYSVKEVAIEALSSVSAFWDFYPSWQNSFESINRAKESFSCLAAYTESMLVGYGVFEPVSGDIAQLAVDKEYRRQGIGSTLLNEMMKLNRNDAVKVVNTAAECLSVTDFLKAKNIAVTGKQFEMLKPV